MKKASAWFRVTYQCLSDQIKKKKKKRRNRRRKNRIENNQQQRQQQQNQKSQNRNNLQLLFSFAWIVYPILMKIYDEKQNSDNI